ncbi:phenylalanine--tRNA ligase subunit beta [Alcanivorax sp. JB21]|uniref:phenylalanine--tRNA ligase subunit beta n=1 Tax=Alcanivorax limicola TaxID=2874102 RepID=UPI001CBB5C30|nr:phenylalanine--tRNA ligase subunit beta [Alcanivorax limicola]MBZ2188099.1 phenylalanine--tRNA ligase subunit beta [Alcanivorax limicola]
MLIIESWLREWADPALDTESLAHQLSMAGLEVDGVTPAAPPFSGVVVGEVKTTAPHPDADKLTVCEVSDGTEVFPVVCGAPNVRAGLKVPFARVGAELPGDFRIKKAKLRGQPSLGMLCGASELGLEDLIDGLLELPADAPVGTDIREYLQLDDQIIEVDLTPNRADCLSVRGIAREVSVLNRVPFNVPAIAPVAPTIDDTFAVTVSAPEACPRYQGRVIRGIDPTAQTPLWMVERLRRSGLRPIDPVVDVTNYVLLELGQPLHAFDLGKLKGGIDVRLAQAGESLTLLDEQTVTLKDDTLVIADANGPLAMAGVMGGAASAVSDGTRDIFLECAFFAPLAIAGKARGYGLHTDSSHRFERGVDPQLQAQAMARATALILAIAGGQAGPVVEVAAEAHLPTPVPIALSAARVEAVLGLSLDAAEIADILARLGMDVVDTGADTWQVTGPSWRFDMAIEADLIEELARVHGYDRLPSRLPAIQGAAISEPETRLPARRLSDLLAARGYAEAITYTFVDPAMQAALAPELTPLALANPISSELAVMRSTLWAGLLTTAQRNLNRQISRLRLFEQGLRFVPGAGEGGGLLQEPMLAGLVFGTARPQHFDDLTDGKPRRVDFLDVKADVEALLAATGGAAVYRFEAAEQHVLHPGQCARIVRDGVEAGWLGKLHPGLAATLDLPADIYLFELRKDVITQVSVPKFSELSEYPSVRRDLALVVPEAVPAGALLESARKACDERLRDIQLFDVYQGDNIEKGHKSLALGLTFQDRSSTLGEADINLLLAGVLSQLKQEFNASLRE